MLNIAFEDAPYAVDHNVWKEHFYVTSVDRYIGFDTPKVFT